jgi:hypothetical protein
MAIHPNPDRNSDYMYQTWGTNQLITDYHSLNDTKKVIQEIMHDDISPKKHHLKEQTNLHKKIRNDENYDDWEYGTEPNYGESWT